MKRLLVILILLTFSSNVNSLPLTLGDKLPGIAISNLVNAPVSTVELQSLKGKVIVLDFWATWCKGCIEGFPKMQSIQNKFADKVQIIAVTDEGTDRIKRFLKNRPLNFWMASDSLGILKQWFPFHSLPHVVIIDAEGIVQAITSGKETTENVIEQVLKGERPSVSFKREIVEEGKVFAEVKTGEEYFEMKGFQAGITGAMSRTSNSLIYINTNFERFYLDAYGVLVTRLRYENIDWSERGSRYCLYLAIKEDNPKKLQETFKQKLEQEFAYRTKLGKETDTVFIVRRIADPDTNWVKPAGYSMKQVKAGERTGRTFISKGSFTATNKTVGSAISEYLEKFGIVDKVVVDETGDSTLFDINFTWEPESVGAVNGFLKTLGLTIEKGVREYDVLVIYK
jgi:thiol-disulfide isomerase/thioredoxin